LCIAVMVSGIGSAMFHPQAARLINRCSASNGKGAGFGIFSFGGNVGFTLGPVLATGTIALFGLKGTLFFLLPSLLFSLIAAVVFRDRTSEDEKLFMQKVDRSVHGKDQWGAFFKLSLFVVFRSVINSGINTFLVLYFISEIGQTENAGNTLLSGYYAVTAVSALLGGKLADSFGYRQTIRLSCIILLPAVLLFALTKSLVAAVILLLPMGIGISLCYSPMVLMGQQYLPGHMGLASGVTLGLAVSIGGICTPLLGRIGDFYGLTAVFFVIATVAVIPLLVSFWLKDAESRTGSLSTE
jgi:FSR family fosmidomycin resistance protein-like MFS transporter